MKFLKDLGFEPEEIKAIEKNIPKLIKEQINNSQELVKANIQYLKDLGVNNYKKAFSLYYDMFLMDNSAFIEVFSKYDHDDLLAKLEKNINIIEHL